MAFSTWLAFLAGVIVICGSPGPNMLQVMSTSAQHGMRRSLPTMAGCFIAVFILIGASVAGIGAFIHAFPNLFDAMRYTGAVYIAYLGYCAWRAPVGSDAAPGPKRGGNLFRQGFLIGISNPKAMLFATAFFPQFLNPDAAQGPQLAILLATFGVVEFSWYLVYAFGGSRLTHQLQKPSIQRLFNRMTGGLFVLFGAAMALKPR